MAWKTELVDIVQVLIGEDCDNPTISRHNLERTIVVAAMQVSYEMTFSQTYVCNLAKLSITPDPTIESPDTRDESYINLVSMKAACILDRGNAVAAARKAVRVRDGNGSIEIDLRDVFKSKAVLLEKGWCKVYEDAKFEYESGQVRVAGAVVLTPFRLYAQGEGVSGYMSSFEGRSRQTGFI